MTEAETRYAQIKKEALAITWACEHFTNYILGKQIQIQFHISNFTESFYDISRSDRPLDFANTKWPNKKMLPQQLSKYWSARHCLTVCDRLLWYRSNVTSHSLAIFPQVK